jgi:hypothetical protein
MNLSEKTLLPISLVGCIILGTLWIADLRGDCNENSNKVFKLEETVAKSDIKIDQMAEQLSRMEAQLEIIKEAVLTRKAFQ